MIVKKKKATDLDVADFTNDLALLVRPLDNASWICLRL
jgi:hypothetical protein